MDLRFRYWTYIQTSFRLKNYHATSSNQARSVCLIFVNQISISCRKNNKQIRYLFLTLRGCVMIQSILIIRDQVFCDKKIAKITLGIKNVWKFIMEGSNFLLMTYLIVWIYICQKKAARLDTFLNKFCSNTMIRPGAYLR